MGSLAVIIPAKNEAGNISRVVAGVRAQVPQAEIIVVDDNSDDGTADAARAQGATLLRSPVSLGIGGGVQLGIRYALERGHDIFVRMDGDGQHPAAAVGDLVRHHAPGRLIQGSRDARAFAASSNPARQAGSIWFRALFRVFTGTDVPDPTSGFMCFDRELAGLFARFYPMDYPEIESLVLLARSGRGIVPVTVAMSPRAGGASSIGWFRAAVYMVSVSIAFFSSFLRRNPYAGAHAH